MSEILLHALNWEHFFDEGFPAYDIGSLGYPVLVAVLRVNLSRPTSISIVGRTYEDLGMEIAELEGLNIGFESPGHDFFFR